MGLRYFVSDDRRDWDQFLGPLTFAHNTTVHRETGLAPVDLVLARPPPTLLVDEADSLDMDGVSPLDVKKILLLRLEKIMNTAIGRLQQAKANYKAEFDRRMRLTKQNLRPGH